MNIGATRLAGFKRLLKEHRGYRVLWSAGVVSQLGDWLSYIAVSALVFTSGAGVWGLAAVFVAHVLPHAVLSGFTGPWVDRLDRRVLLMVSDAVRALLTLAMAWAAWQGAILALEVLLILRVSVGAVALPARSAALPRLVPREHLVEANALSALTWSVLFALGVALGGVLAAWVGPTTAIVVDALTYVLALSLHALLPALRPRDRASDDGRRDMREAVSLLGRRPELWRAVTAKAPLAVAGGGGWITLNLLSLDELAWGALALGLLHAVRGIGTGVGPLVGKVTTDVERLLPWDLFTLTMVVVFSVSGELGWLLALSFAWGMGSGRNWVISTAALQERADDAVLGRLSALELFVLTGAQAAGALLGAAAVQITGQASAAGVLGASVGLLLLLSVRAIGATLNRRAPVMARVELRPPVERA